MDSKKPIISASLYLAGKKINLAAITQSLNIEPTRVRKMEDWPEPSKAAGLAYDLWVLGTEKEHSKSVSNHLQKLANLISGREEKIVEICNRYNLEVNVEIVIHMDSMSSPEIILSKELMRLFASINAEVGFDMYTY